MATYLICTDSNCSGTITPNIPAMLDNHLDDQGIFRCRCGAPGYMERNFKLQEDGQTWEPFLRGAIKLANPEDTYQPFVFLCSSTPDGPIDETWFCYYKDTRKYPGGRLKMGYGPGGPPVLGNDSIVELVHRMLDMRLLDRKLLQKALDETAGPRSA